MAPTSSASSSTSSPATASRDDYQHRSLSRATTDRDAARRSEPGLLESLAADPATRLVLVDAHGRVALAGSAVHPDLPQDGLTPAEDAVWSGGRGDGPALAPVSAAELDLSGLTTVYLGRETGTGTGDAAGTSWLGVAVPDEDEADEALAPDAEGARHARPDLHAVLAEHPLSALRALGVELSAHDVGLATPAVALAAWHARSRFCPACGSPTDPAEAGWARRCRGCGAVQFPRTDPAVIMAVTSDDDRIVLVHGASWAPHRYSTVAGFVEAGEAAEAAVAREVAEETGLVVDSCEFVTSQPWPFPRSLMLGYRARLVPGPVRPKADDAEVTDVVVLSRHELAEAARTGEVILPGRTSIARMLIEDWYGGALPRQEA